MFKSPLLHYNYQIYYGKKKKKDKSMLMDALSRLSNSDTIEKPKPIFQNSWKSI